MNLLIGILQYNKSAVTSKCITCIENYTHDINYSIYLLDNNSSDGSFQEIINFCKDKKNITIEKSDTNTGVIGGRNIIFNFFKQHTQFTHIMFIDNDQFVKEKWIEGYVSIFKLHDKSVCGIEAWILSSNFTPLRKCSLKDSGFSYVGCGGMMISREAFDEIGLFDESFNPAYFEDPDYCLRAYDKKIPVLWNKHSKIDHIPHQTLGQRSLNASMSFRKSLNNFRNKWRGKFGGGIIFRNHI